MAEGAIVPSEAFDAALLDLDGVVYVGPKGVPHATESINAAIAAGMRIGYVTNNASRSAATVREQLQGLGVSPTLDEVITSAQLAAEVLAERHAPGTRILVVGGPGLHDAITDVGLVPVATAAESPAAVVQGFGPDVSWRALAEASYAVSAGVPWVATNADLTIPTTGGIAPGNGALIGTVRAATGANPEVIGKPSPAGFIRAARRLGAVRPLVVGDRLDTDIEGAVASGQPSLLVLTGVTRLADVLTAAPVRRPTFLAPDLRWLNRPVHRIEGDGPEMFVAGARVAAHDRSIDVEIGQDPVAAAAALVAFAWAHPELDPAPGLVNVAAALERL